MTRRLLLSYLTVTVFVLLILELPLAVFFKQREFDRLTADVERDATVMATIYEDFLETGSPGDPIPANEYAADTGARVVVVNADGISITDTEGTADRDFSTRPEFEIALVGDRASGVRFSTTLDTDLLYVAVPVASGGTVRGAVRLTLDPHEVTERVHQFWWGLVGIAAVILAVVAAVGWALARSVSRPVRRLEATAARFAIGDLSPTTPDSRAPAEVASLEQAMNTMAGRLDRMLGQQREFVADASHQLRTPLTALRLRLENLGIEIEETDQAIEVDSAVAEIDRLSDLVSDLLRLARAERQVALEPVDLFLLASERIDTWTAVAEEAKVSLVMSGDSASCTGSVAPGTVEQVLDNLLDNAVRACTPDGTVSVEVSKSAIQVRLTVTDDGGGMAEEQLARATERFWRGEQTTPGTGLGLPIVKSLIEASGGTFQLANKVDADGERSGLMATVALPLVLP